MSKTFPILPFILFFAALTFGQTPSLPCPSISISGPMGPVDRNVFTLSTGKEIDGYNVTYKWSATQGDIVARADEKSIEVLNVDFEGKNLTVTVEISGLPPNCLSTASESMAVSIHAKTIQIDEIRGSLVDMSKERFDKIHSVAAQNPNALLYIVVSAGKTNETSIRRKQMNLVDRLTGHPAYRSTFHDRRITFVHSNKNDDKIVFWLVPAGNDLPTP
ncbi:MAG: hypothetical protein QM785_01190 [Pyrinomonadaceae bacterium]